MIKKIIIVLLMLTLSLALISWLYFSPVDPSDNTLYQISVEKGDGVSTIANKLKEKNLVRDTVAFKTFVVISRKTANLKVGEYQFSPSLNLGEIVANLALGKTEDIKITIVEGLRREEINDQLGKIFGEDFKKKFNSLTANREGRLFPDTYFLKKDTKAEDLAKLLNDNFEKKYSEVVRSQKRELNKSEIIILASIVEREAKYDADRPIIAGILYKRLKNNWPLDVDATVQYAIGFVPLEKTWWKKKLTEEDLNIDSPFNTRKNLGFPPSPICNPGQLSIDAAANPIDAPYWFYLSDPKGNMHYAKTLAEQEENISKYIDKQ